MGRFFDAMTNKDAETLNGMPAFSTTGNALLDFYFMAGGSRDLSSDSILGFFTKALAYSKIDAMVLLFAVRDIRGGMGERRVFRIILRYLADTYPEIVKNILHLVPEYGRWDDLFSVFGTLCEKESLQLIAQALYSSNGLCAKWMPREGKKGFKEYGTKIAKFMNLTHKQYRKLLVSLTKVVENDMSANRWHMIKYESVPSVAFNKYSKSFRERDTDRFLKFLEDVKNKKVTIKASAIFPYDIVNTVITGKENMSANLQWLNLPDYINGDVKFLPVCDVSGSMYVKNRSVSPIVSAISLSIYLAERNKSELKDIVCTFSDRPVFVKLGGYLSDKVKQLATSNWGYNTDLGRVFDVLLSYAKQSRLTKGDMPDYILILSDMQFDSCIKFPEDSVMEMIERKYKESGYDTPKIIFWNLNSYSNFPLRFDTRNVLLVSGYSPAILTMLFDYTRNPLDLINKILNNPRYLPVVNSL